MSLLERQRIATLYRQGLGVRAIAAVIGRAASTVSRELRRITLPHDRGGYDGDLAHARARQRAQRPRRSRLIDDPQLRAEVQDKLELEWSPEQIAAHLRQAFPDRPRWHVCHETIYQALYQGGGAPSGDRLRGPGSVATGDGRPEARRGESALPSWRRPEPGNLGARSG